MSSPAPTPLRGTFDFDNARSLLQHAGGTGLQLDVAFANTLPKRVRIAQICRADLDNIGVKTNITTSQTQQHLGPDRNLARLA